MPRNDTVRALDWQGDHLKLLDQRRLPAETVWLDCHSAADTADAIRDMVVRGAPAIGIAAAYGVVLAARAAMARRPADWPAAMAADLARLRSARPTAVNLFWALDRMQQVVDSDPADPLAALEAAAVAIHEDDLTANRRMGELGAHLIPAGAGVLTHCNTGSLATGGYGTALGVIRSAWSGKGLSAVYADETRPWLQGARLTAWELVADGIPVRLIAEGAAPLLMQRGRVDWVIVGADRVAANGDTANKIGTYALALACKAHGVKFMVVAPSSTIDLDCPGGDRIPIEERPPEELLWLGDRRVAAEGAGAWNPVFDVTPAELIDVLVTERGVVTDFGGAGVRALING
ncbi:S-methyl-5-thioribose-1-phosphate isomerase [Alkalilimnicola ehrlichii MLHE-1]|uniref:Methylthioribose-1-phosphate isomerase n=1 Tax=Alkalilimnicola ehrlichii (strain ATCC BAA-1101 / DSM 17681 / MLHE-1) TaxID=187272 RepID=MTNA_ALKEH|nr:S-methyl-5-thioribose-1-phosphate isomerase [Alkalilimnicola ehrlichii]Q0AA70.1 RecName: Full=Methylthioribose-1-phosphate isomerase; Short=M1Pi; Short=MTR-1-P isomerase; AltName: Full=S-methyl-5-thioribose-1-phosphate isomerase [Alkalilimnicola ehrlichii MLHE-1]ABI56267.1 methylthioribose-1-phosphate isomerase [Alkalilimnicola ehrlichii MLHE-1]